jgi:protein-disulfide isomerase
MAARAARCAGEQGNYWEMRHAILANNSALQQNSFNANARELGLDVHGFQECLADSHRFESELKKDRDAATAVGIAGTPSFVIGRTQASRGVLEGIRLVGAIPFGALDGTLKALLTKPDAQ